jgi:hypothetical protein
VFASVFRVKQNCGVSGRTNSVQMCEGFIKFPRTPHLLWPLARAPKDDRVLSASQCEAFLDGDVTVEEKVDGANIGFSLDDRGAVRVQNRGSWIQRGAHPQFGPLWTWIADRTSQLRELLGPDLLLFGEWCFAVHSVRYDRLPDWFLAFDVFDCISRRFWSSARRDSLLTGSRICQVPRVSVGKTSAAELQHVLDSETSSLTSHAREGLYLRREGALWLEVRAKLVRPEFLLAMGEHWSAGRMNRNKLASPVGRPAD